MARAKCPLDAVLVRREGAEPLLRNELHAALYLAQVRGESLSREALSRAVLSRICEAHRLQAALLIARLNPIRDSVRGERRAA